MARRLANRVKETTQTTGTGTLDLDGAVTGFQAFRDEINSNDQMAYLIEDDPSAPTLWEYGIGRLTTGTPDTLARESVQGSSNGGSLVSLPAGNKVVTCALLKDDLTPDGLARVRRLPLYYFTGFETAAAADADHDVTIQPGTARDDADGADISLASALTKQIDATFATGNNAGGMQTGETVQADTWYALYAIRQSGTGVVDAFFSPSFSSPSLPSGYTQKRYIRAYRTDGSANIIPSYQAGDFFGWSLYQAEAANADPGVSAVLKTLAYVPPRIVRPKLLVRLNETTAAATYLLVNSPLGSNDTPGANNHTVWISGSLNDQSREIDVWTNASGQVRFELTRSDSDLAVNMTTFGYHDPRNRL